MNRLSHRLWTCSLLALASAAEAVETVTFRYDALGRLVATSSTDTVNPGVTSSIGYDAAGNRSIYAASVSGAPAFSISDVSGIEGGGLVFTIVKNGTGAASVSFATANGSAGAGGDYSAAGGSLSFAAGESSKTVTVASIEDSSDEAHETLSLNLSGASAGATIADSQGVGTILDNDEPPPPPPPPPPVFSVSDASVTEGGALQFTVTKTGATTGSFGVTYEATHNTATATWDPNNPGDFYRTSSSLYFAPAESSKTISIHTVDDALDENIETLFLNLTSSTGGATISDAQGIGTIVDNDDPPPPPPPGNAAPTPANDSGTINRCQEKAFNVLVNDSDPDGHSLTITGVTGYGFWSTSTQVWVDSTNLSDGAQGVYTVSDGHGGTATAILTITFSGAGNCNN
jgi:Calx-beta domain/Bacterial cadherin-like domain